MSEGGGLARVRTAFPRVLCTMRHRMTGTWELDVVPMMLRLGCVCVPCGRLVAARRWLAFGPKVSAKSSN